MHYSELTRRYILDRAAIMFVTDLIRDTLTSQTLRRNAIAPEMDVISTLTTLTYLATGKMQIYSSDDLGLSLITQTFMALSELYFVTVHFLIFFKYDSIVNNIYTYVMCVCVWERVR